MKIIKYLLFLILILFIAGSIYVATKEGDYRVEETKIIPAPASLLYKNVQDRDSWNLSLKNDGEPNGFIQTVEAVPISSIQQQLILKSSISDIEMESNWEFEPVEGGTKVTWTVNDDLNFKEKFALTFRDGNLDQLLQPVLLSSLIHLEEVVKGQMEEYSINVDGVTQHGGGFYMYMTTAAHNDEVYVKASDMFDQVNLYMNSNSILRNGEPFILYNERNENTGTSIFSAAIPTPSQVITPTGSPVLCGMMPAQKVVKITLKGNFKNAPEAWQAGYRYIEENDLDLNKETSPFEIFYTSPSEEENPALWVTEIYLPVF